MIEQAITEFLIQKEKINPKIDEKKYKIKFTMTSKFMGGVPLDTKMCVKI